MLNNVLQNHILHTVFFFFENDTRVPITKIPTVIPGNLLGGGLVRAAAPGGWTAGAPPAALAPALGRPPRIAPPADLVKRRAGMRPPGPFTAHSALAC